MDQLFKRYADPFSFMDGMIQTERFEEFIDSFVETVTTERDEKFNWEFFLHKVWEGTFDDFKATVKQNKTLQTLSARTIETTVQESMNILKNFRPEGGEV